MLRVIPDFLLQFGERRGQVRFHQVEAISVMHAGLVGILAISCRYAAAA